MVESYIELAKKKVKDEFCIQFMKYHWMEGMSIREIAKKIGKHHTAIYNRARFSDLPIRTAAQVMHHYLMYKKPPNMKKMVNKIKLKELGRKRANEMWKQIREWKQDYEKNHPTN